MEYLLGIDVGTSALKAMLFDRDGGVAASVSAEYPVYHPAAGAAEQKPDDWWAAAVSAIKDCITLSGVQPKDIAAVGLTGQMHGITLLDKHGGVLRDAIIWCDIRAGRQAEELERIIGKDKLIALTANTAQAGFSAAKLMRLKELEPQIIKDCAAFLLPKDYIRYKLSGVCATEVSDAGGTQLFDVGRRQWAFDLVKELGFDKKILPTCLESSTVSSYVSTEGANLTGLIAGTPIVGGAGDQAAAAVGSGVNSWGTMCCTVGTSGVVFAYNDTPSVDKLGRVHTLCHAVSGTWHSMGVTQSAGLSVKWLKEQFYKGYGYKYIDNQIAAAEIGAGGVVYLPYLMGERSPHNDTNAKGAFYGLTAQTETKHLARAVMEGVSYSLKDCLEVMLKLGSTADFITVNGGGANSGVWLQMLADVFNTTIAANPVPDAGCLGAAVLAACGAGLYPTVTAAYKNMSPLIGKVYTPQNAEAYADSYALYKSLYPVLKPIFDRVRK